MKGKEEEEEEGKKGEGGGGGGGRRGDGGGKPEKGGDQRHWCVLDGSTLICYSDEEVLQCYNRMCDLFCANYVRQ